MQGEVTESSSAARAWPTEHLVQPCVRVHGVHARGCVCVHGCVLVSGCVHVCAVLWARRVGPGLLAFHSLLPLCLLVTIS